MAKIIITIVIILTILGGGYFVWSKGRVPFIGSGQNSQVSEIKSKGKLVVGTDATYPPLEYLDNKGAIVGLDADIAAEIAKDMNVKLDLVNIPFDRIFEALDKGEVDLVISSVTITTDRQKTMLFSTPYLNAGQVVVTKVGVDGILSVTDIKGRRVGVQGGTTSETEAKKYGAVVSKYADYDLAKSDLLAAKIDAIIIDYPAGISMAQASNDLLEVKDKPFTSEFYGIVAPLAKNGLIDSVNRTISRLKSSGDLGKLEHLWFGL